MTGVLAFTVHARSGGARCGVIETPRGTVQTPAFAPVASYGAVRGVDFAELQALGAEIVLANAFHLHERPGEAVVAAAGGLHAYTGWPGLWLTDSGGFQVHSLAGRARISEAGVVFNSPVDGRRRELTPESAVAIQETLGADIAMVLDEVVDMDGGERPGKGRAASAMERSLRWAERGLAARRRGGSGAQALFGIVQGGIYGDLRRESARHTAALGFDGYAHGGLGLGESPALRTEMIAEADALLPEDKPRYLMGLGRPEDLVAAMACGVDLFDCVVPTRHGRHGVAFTGAGRLNLKSVRFRQDFGPLDADCDCPCCARYSRAYVCHLLRINERLGQRLASLHNLRFTLRLMERAREAIRAGCFDSLRREVEQAATGEAE